MNIELLGSDTPDRLMDAVALQKRCQELRDALEAAQNQYQEAHNQLPALWSSECITSHVGSGYDSQQQLRVLPVDLESICLPCLASEASGWRTCTAETLEKGCASLSGLAAAATVLTPCEEGLLEVAPGQRFKHTTVWLNDNFAKLVDQPDRAGALRVVNMAMGHNRALQCITLAVLKDLLLEQQPLPRLSRAMMHHSVDRPTDIMPMWHLPVRYQEADGKIHDLAYISLTSRHETSLRLYETLMLDHVALKFTPSLVTVVDAEGNVLAQNEASMAALGFQGKLHRQHGSGPGFNLLQELFVDEPELMEEMKRVADSHQLFSRVTKIVSPTLRRWLGLQQPQKQRRQSEQQQQQQQQQPRGGRCTNDSGREVWHKVQVSRARDPVSMSWVYVVAQIDVSDAVDMERRAERLQAENTDLHWTTTWLEGEKERAREENQRLKANLEEVLAARDEAVAAGHPLAPRPLIDTDSPADKAVQLMNKILAGEQVSVREALEVRDAIITAGSDLLQPVNFRAQMQQMGGEVLDADVGQSLIDLLARREITLSPTLTRSSSLDEEQLSIPSPSLERQGSPCSSEDLELPASSTVTSATNALEDRGSNDRPSTHSSGTLRANSGSVSAAGGSQQQLGSAGGAGVAATVQPGGATGGSTPPRSTPDEGGVRALFRNRSVRSRRSAEALLEGEGAGPRAPPSRAASLLHLLLHQQQQQHQLQHHHQHQQQSAFAGDGAASDRSSASSMASVVLRNRVCAYGMADLANPLQGLLEVGRSPPDHLAAALASADDWAFDAFALASASDGRPLSALTYALLRRHCGEALAACHVDDTRLCRCLIRLEDMYNDNPYHNRTHAADVVHALHMMFTRGGVLEALGLSDPARLAAYLAAAVHDVGHRGVNNDFLVRTGDTLALLYNDASPMENHHLAATFGLMAQEPYNFMARASPRIRDVVRKLMIQMVLATDMKQHFAQTTLFRSKLQISDDDPGPRAARHSIGSAPREEEVTSAASPRDPQALWQTDDEIKTLVMAVCLKCADLGHLASPPDVHMRWVQLLEEELWRQGDREVAAGLPISALMDRTKPGVTKSQTGFFNIVALPLFRSMCKAFPGVAPMLQSVEANSDEWAELERKAMAVAVAAPMGATAAASG